MTRKILLRSGITASLLLSSQLFASTGIPVGPVQENLNGPFLTRERIIPKSANCDPSAIERNLQALADANILNATNLTKTEAAGTACYGPCPEDIEKATQEHCKKAEALAKIVKLIKRL